MQASGMLHQKTKCYSLPKWMAEMRNPLSIKQKKWNFRIRKWISLFFGMVCVSSTSEIPFTQVQFSVVCRSRYIHGWVFVGLRWNELTVWSRIQFFFSKKQNYYRNKQWKKIICDFNWNEMRLFLAQWLVNKLKCRLRDWRLLVSTYPSVFIATHSQLRAGWWFFAIEAPSLFEWAET